jgi:hypothetical protein
MGDYAFELLGWGHGRPPGEQANLITQFRARLSAPDAAWLRHRQNIESSAWNDPGITDRAVGIPFPMHDIRLALARISHRWVPPEGAGAGSLRRSGSIAG